MSSGILLAGDEERRGGGADELMASFMDLCLRHRLLKKALSLHYIFLLSPPPHSSRIIYKYVFENVVSTRQRIIWIRYAVLLCAVRSLICFKKFCVCV